VTGQQAWGTLPLFAIRKMVSGANVRFASVVSASLSSSSRSAGRSGSKGGQIGIDDVRNSRRKWVIKVGRIAKVQWNERLQLVLRVLLQQTLERGWAGVQRRYEGTEAEREGGIH
jgi:hypothetical protein